MNATLTLRDEQKRRICTATTLASLTMSAALFAPSTAFATSDTKKDENKSAETAPPPVKDDLFITDEYVHKWISAPRISGKSIFNQQPVTIEPKKGEALVVFFVGSWCLPCQQLFPQMIAINDRFKDLHTRFIYVFSHDTVDDVQNFAKQYGLDESKAAILADHRILKDFHNPKLPSIYVIDRTKWLNYRYIDTNEEGLKKLTHYLERVNAF